MRRLLSILPLAATLCGCVSVKSEHGLVPPSGLVTDLRAPLVVPREPVPCENLKLGTGSGSVFVKDWLYTGIGADVCNMALQEAVENGGIRRLYFADYEQYSIFGFVTIFTVTAHGE